MGHDKQVLVINFNDSYTGKDFKFRLSNPKSDLDGTTIGALAETIAEEGIFSKTLVPESAFIITTKTEEYGID